MAISRLYGEPSIMITWYVRTVCLPLFVMTSRSVKPY